MSHAPLLHKIRCLTDHIRILCIEMDLACSGLALMGEYIKKIFACEMIPS